MKISELYDVESDFAMFVHYGTDWKSRACHGLQKLRIFQFYSWVYSWLPPNFKVGILVTQMFEVSGVYIDELIRRGHEMTCAGEAGAHDIAADTVYGVRKSPNRPI